MDASEKDILNFLFEAGMLKRVKNEGVRTIGVDFPESAADHALRAAQIGFILAKMEGYSKPEEVCTMLVFHELSESRTGDLHNIARKYVVADEERAVKDQTATLGEMGAEILAMWKQVEERNTEAGVISKDADWLERALTAKGQVELGFLGANEWIESVQKAVKTKSAKKLLESLKESDSGAWRKNLGDYQPKRK